MMKNCISNVLESSKTLYKMQNYKKLLELKSLQTNVKKVDCLILVISEKKANESNTS